MMMMMSAVMAAATAGLRDSLFLAADNAANWVDLKLHGLRPFQVVGVTALTLLLLRLADQVVSYFGEHGLVNGVVLALMSVLKRMPGTSGMIAKEQAKMAEKMKQDLLADNEGMVHAVLPKDGLGEAALFKQLREWAKVEDSKWQSGKISGSVYHGGKQLSSIIAKAYTLFEVSNPLHPDTFPYTRKMEAQIVSMVVDLLNGGKDGCGLCTSGGTESILMAMKVYRERATERGIRRPELVVPESAHAAFRKACDYFKIKLVQVKLDSKTFKVDIRAVRKAITRNTIAIVGSAPQYAQGVMDDIGALSKLAVKYDVGLHVDCCLGSYLMPLLNELGWKLPPFDFTLPGVTSISCDSHKYGFCPKGISVIAYRNADLRRYQYYVSPSWSGGIYATQSVAGSRSGGIIAGAWATMMYLGRNGYKKLIKDIVECADDMRNTVRAIPELELQGESIGSVLSVQCTSKSKMDIYMVGEAMHNRGWGMASVQYPRGIHLAVTVPMSSKAKEFARDLKASVKEVREHPERFKSGQAAMYGMAETIPDRSMITGLAKSYLDALYTV